MTIGDRIKIIRDLAGLSQDAFATSIGIKRSTIAQIESGNQLPTIKILLEIVRNYNTTYDYLIDGKNDTPKTKVVIQDDPTLKGKSNIIPIDFAGDIDTVEIPIVDIYAAAGHGAINSDHIEQLGVIKLPANMVKRGTNYCVRIKGSSMAPTIQDSDYVIVRLLEPSEWQSMPDQHVYLVVDREGAAYLKRVKNRFEKGFIVCTSDSIEKSLYPNFNLDTDEVFNIFHAEWHFSAKMQNINETYYSRLQLLEDDMADMKEYIKRIK